LSSPRTIGRVASRLRETGAPRTAPQAPLRAHAWLPSAAVLSSASVEGRDAATVVPSAWPALLALAVVVLLSIGMLGTDLLVEYRTADETTKLVDNALRSVALADDLRSQAHLLAANPVGREVPRAVLAQIARDTTRYEPLATYEGERAEWTRLRGLLDRLRDTQTTDARAVDPALVRAIETSLDQVVRINEREAARSVAVIRAAHRQAFMIDAAAGAVTFLLAVVVATALVRLTSRGRASDRTSSRPSRDASRTICAGRSRPSAGTPTSCAPTAARRHARSASASPRRPDG
jgi:hypothetical protein